MFPRRRRPCATRLPPYSIASATSKNGERVEVLDREKRFARVRTSTGIEGWIEQRFLVDQKTFDALQKLTADNQNDPVQAPGVLRNDTNLHVTPGRDSEHLYQLASGAKVSILKRETAEKQTGAVPAAKATAKIAAKAQAGPILEDWWLVRDTLGRVGWVLARMVDIDVPLDIAQYAEGQRFVAFFPLNAVPDNDKGVQKQVPQYLCVLTDPHDGLPFDFDQVRVFTWNTHKHRYETAYREHGLNGVLPVTITKEDFDKEGTLPVFILRVKDDADTRNRAEIQAQHSDCSQGPSPGRSRYEARQKAPGLGRVRKLPVPRPIFQMPYRYCCRSTNFGRQTRHSNTKLLETNCL